MTARPRVRMLRAAALAVTALVLTACAGLPTSGDVAVGLKLGESTQEIDFLPVAPEPMEGSGPAQIVEGFLEAGVTTTDNWATARKFLSPELQRAWKPSAGVSIDAGADTRVVTGSVPEAEIEDADTAEVQVQLDLVASVDAAGAYAEALGPSSMPFSLARMDDGEWRITEAPDGVVVDAERFDTVFEGYSLQYFDATWTRLVPDMRWFPRRQSPATSVTQALIDGKPSEWLAPAVQSAFPVDVQLAQDAVPTTGQVAEVALTRSAATLDETTLSRMRTQLQATLKAAGVPVEEVRFTVDGRALDAGLVDLATAPAEPGSLVLRGGEFGRIVGGEIEPLPDVSDEIEAIADPIRTIDVAADGALAATQLGDGHVYVVVDGSRNELDARAGLIPPSLDPYGYTWTVPAAAPGALQAWDTEVVKHPIANAWPNASQISDLRVSADGARVAAVVTVGGQRWVVVAAVVRDGAGAPVELGDIKQLVRIDQSAIGLVWLGADRLGVLVDPGGPRLISQLVGGPGSSEAAPSDAVSIAGARTPAGVRILGAEGGLHAHAGSAWRVILDDVSVLATRAGE